MKCFYVKSYAAAAILFSFLLVSCAVIDNPGVTIPPQTPWTKKDFLSNPANFQFAVIGDRTGGHRPGVFSRAMAQINLLQPEFVVSVGDLIEGYTDDTVELNHQWDYLDKTVNTLDMPFFYTVGNHDISNNLMRDLWRNRLGKDYYHFIYKNVLFISLNTEDPPIELPPEAVAGQLKLEQMMKSDPEGTQQALLERSRKAGNQAPLPGKVEIGSAQLDFVEKTLGDNENVRWTILLMHKPAWQYGNQQFERIEGMLQDRDYTVIAGHEHYYMYSRRHGRDYIDMGTTGGIWLRDGSGRLDHIALVTMTEKGPVFANISLDGLFDKHGPGD